MSFSLFGLMIITLLQNKMIFVLVTTSYPKFTKKATSADSFYHEQQPKLFCSTTTPYSAEIKKAT